MNPLHKILLALAALSLAACSKSLPKEYDSLGEKPALSIDLDSVAVPVNIAPLNFRIEEEGSDYITHIYTGQQPDGMVLGGRDLDIPVGRWHSLAASAQGDSITISVFAKSGGKWRRYAPVKIAVADSIDPYISYRLIEPSYIGFEQMAICQRHLENFDEREIFENQALSTEDEGQCINCHSYQNYNRTGNMQMHVRGRLGGTVIAHNGTLKMVNLKSPETISNGVYPSWHPTEPLIAYSLNETTQTFHSRDIDKIEVQDSHSDLVLYDPVTDSVKFIVNDSLRLETFPYWHPDGKSLWYVAADVPYVPEEKMSEFHADEYQTVKYDLYRISFDPATRAFGEPERILAASEMEASVTLPRPSPDGRYLLFTVGNYGTFHIWHRESDLYLLDIANQTLRPAHELNSPNVESYHSWSSNGRWVIFSTRRDDGSYTRLYIAHFRPDGTFSKPFPLPQSTPDADLNRMKSYNIPEFMACPVTISKRRLIETILGQ